MRVMGRLTFVDGVDLLSFHELLGIHDDVFDDLFVEVDVEGAGRFLAFDEVELLLLLGDGFDLGTCLGLHGFADDFVDGDVFGVVGGEGGGLCEIVACFVEGEVEGH